MGSFAKWTSTTKAEWKKECDAFRKAGVPFKIKGVQTDEHRTFVLSFAAQHRLSVAHGDGTVYIAPPEALG
jgi:hypothetical protein